MISNSTIVFFAILILANLVYGQSGRPAATTPSPTTTVSPSPAPSNSIASCISQYYVVTASDYLNCHAKCAGVPNPSEEDIDKTNQCVTKCNQTNSDDYEKCQNECFKGYFTTTAATISNTMLTPPGSSIYYTSSAVPTSTVDSYLPITPSSSSHPSSSSGSPNFLKPFLIGLGIGLGVVICISAFIFYKSYKSRIKILEIAGDR